VGIKVRVAVIGGTGHIGSYLTPMLVEAGHEVTCVCRNVRQPYREHPAWNSISYCKVDRIEDERTGSFGERISQLNADVVVDLTCYHLDSAQQLVAALQRQPVHLLHCGTIWVHGHSIAVPTTEDEPRQPFGDYGIRKAAIEAWLLQQAKDTGLAVSVLHPGHLVGPGWTPINPAGNFNPAIYSALMHGEEIRLPNFGMETVHHVHAEDVAQAFTLAIRHRQAALGQAFHVTSASALTLRGYAESLAAWLGKPARLQFQPWDEWKLGVSEKDARVTEDHIRHSPHCSIQKARAVLGYEPRYSSLQAVEESVTQLIASGII
jgi:nucleoside-diphosphate-sugar epimerase